MLPPTRSALPRGRSAPPRASTAPDGGAELGAPPRAPTPPTRPQAPGARGAAVLQRPPPSQRMSDARRKQQGLEGEG
jgi:hypothetical protein